MSVYTTLWVLRLPATGDYYAGCSWTQIYVQAEAWGPDAVLCGALAAGSDPTGPHRIGIGYRSIACVAREHLRNEGGESDQPHPPLLELSGDEYERTSFEQLLTRLADALRGAAPELLSESTLSDGRTRLVFSDGTTKIIDRSDAD